MISEITILNKTYIRAESVAQFVYSDGPKKGRRRVGLPYYLAYTDDDTGHSILIQSSVTNQTSGEWIKSAISSGRIYLRKTDHEITSLATQDV